jgi:hypothetical protein
MKRPLRPLPAASTPPATPATTVQDGAMLRAQRLCACRDALAGGDHTDGLDSAAPKRPSVSEMISVRPLYLSTLTVLPRTTGQGGVSQRVAGQPYPYATGG